jgi:hypothetical protein
MSFKPEVIADDSGRWAGNALRFAMREEAEENVANLADRWLLVRETRSAAMSPYSMAVAPAWSWKNEMRRPPSSQGRFGFVEFMLGLILFRPSRPSPRGFPNQDHAI